MAKKLESRKDLMDLALFYCSQRETSRAKMAQYLTRKCREQDLDQPDWIEQVLDECERFKVIDDARFSEILVREYERRGKGKRYIDQKLKQKGIDQKTTPTAYESEESEETRALEVAEKFWGRLLKQKIKLPKSHHGRPNSETYLRKQKLMQKLVAAGYSFDLVKKVAQKVAG